ncbi:MAG: hypothetical protein DRG78_13875 [Epsilonproteobacteria bacterium]|nr:MAG: hypothetical protein DRG78_13875 [Campylobacterota bacterium]
MALIKCIDCENEYSDKAEACPGCGCPTINNTISEKRKNIKECSINITGNETFNYNLSLKEWIILGLFLIIGTGMRDLSIGMGMVDLTLFYFIIGGIIIFIMRIISFNSREKKANIVNDYFKEIFILLDKLPSNYTETKIINSKSSMSKQAMFEIYMQAYKFNADALIINDSNVSTSVSGRKGSTSSSNTFYITATLVRY